MEAGHVLAALESVEDVVLIRGEGLESRGATITLGWDPEGWVGGVWEG